LSHTLVELLAKRLQLGALQGGQEGRKLLLLGFEQVSPAPLRLSQLREVLCNLRLVDVGTVRHRRSQLEARLTLLPLQLIALLLELSVDALELLPLFIVQAELPAKHAIKCSADLTYERGLRRRCGVRGESADGAPNDAPVLSAPTTTRGCGLAPSALCIRFRRKR
jgi:hypothetical protein